VFSPAASVRRESFSSADRAAQPGQSFSRLVVTCFANALQRRSFIYIGVYDGVFQRIMPRAIVASLPSQPRFTRNLARPSAYPALCTGVTQKRNSTLPHSTELSFARAALRFAGRSTAS